MALFSKIILSLLLMFAVLSSGFTNEAIAQESRSRVVNQPATQAGTVAAPTPAPDVEKTEAQKQGLLPKSIPGFANQPEAKDFQEVCRNIRITNKDDLELNDMEERLICGDNSGGEIGTPWAQIPPNEASYFLKGFLQTRGYHQPQFIQDGLLLFVRVGPVSALKEFRLLGGPESWKPPRRRLIQGEPLTPALLNDLEAWALSQIKNEGYACAETEVRADPETGEVIVFFKPHGQRRIRNLEEAGDTGLREGALDRYNAFLINDVYRERWVSLTRRRTQDDGFLQTLVLNTRCDDGDAVTLIRDVNLGPSRTIRVGVGGSTLEGARVQAIIRRNRIGTSASSAQARARISWFDETLNSQTASANVRWYYLHAENRYYLQPEIVFEHRIGPAIDSDIGLVKFLHGWTFETTNGQWELRAGPDFQNENQRAGPAPKEIRIGYLEAGARWTDHDFEWFTSSPRTGKYLDLSYYGAVNGVGASYDVHRVQLQGQKIWQIGHLDPPLFILATRFNLSSVFAANDSIRDRLPTNFLTFLGGEGDIRGYRLKEITRNGGGALSGATASVEGRFHKVLFRRADVFAFVDGGRLGDKSFSLEDPLILSPGLGVRWESPFGTLRGYGARGMLIDSDSGATNLEDKWRIGITFGEEF